MTDAQRIQQLETALRKIDGIAEGAIRKELDPKRGGYPLRKITDIAYSALNPA